MSLLSSLLLLIVVARLFGRLFARYNQPELIGEILAGVLLGPAILGLIEPNKALAGVTELAVFLIILNAGLEMRFSDIVGAMKGRGLMLAAISFFIPFGGGVLVAAAFGQDIMRMIFLGLCISITALPVAVKLMDSLGILHTPIAKFSLATAVVNDVAALFILGIVLNLPETLTLGDASVAVGIATLKLMAMGLVVVGLNQLLNWLEKRNVNVQALPESMIKVFGPEALFGIVIVFVLVFGTISEALGFHFVIGAFFGALFLDKKHFIASRYKDLQGTLGSITNGFLGPIFFAYLGLELQLVSLTEWNFPLVVILVSIITKLFAGWLGGLMVGMDHRESLGLGAVLNGRGVMELVVAGIAYQNGFIGPTMFSTLVLMGIVTTFLTPIFFKQVYRGNKLEEYRQESRS
ncbi:MAG: sodium:proton antiporter [Sutterellaceae bacterium]|jgi:Kef-type K+ transport system membrane component KefB|uniref:cation:proton antiporter n=1 Tax=unclassified Limnobacter TaxID=2630203 RepID=UPI000C57BB36|nr:MULTISPECIES: cation:proton antiporter [unclassified Limnobacter]MAG79753.1 sodium:proton antiporter [Sutterellaceae bacterium]PZO14312.1 MAG: cation:proton antiporter [Betaproteobacteria bacterium]MBT83257.1 sodium:proton antiporter [Sutterellaceae bacterium]PZO23605.1 MAG: cation:proton antiporter [Betaproteobacteria bacterium]PZO27885.1 MAG: cation:proton antiporter [Betaproteobacteria bacterium]|tara:strand:+ start:5108 stop:6328 length:1221 start_codon:yes stop_codon:yes gene_type:complete